MRSLKRAFWDCCVAAVSDRGSFTQVVSFVAKDFSQIHEKYVGISMKVFWLCSRFFAVKKVTFLQNF